MSTLRSEVGTTVCSDFSESIEDDSFERLFESSTAPLNVKTDRDDFDSVQELYQMVILIK